MLIIKSIPKTQTGDIIPFKVESSDGKELDAYLDHTRENTIIVNIQVDEASKKS